MNLYIYIVLQLFRALATWRVLHLDHDPFTFPGTYDNPQKGFVLLSLYYLVFWVVSSLPFMLLFLLLFFFSNHCVVSLPLIFEFKCSYGICRSSLTLCLSETFFFCSASSLFGLDVLRFSLMFLVSSVFLGYQFLSVPLIANVTIPYSLPY